MRPAVLMPRLLAEQKSELRRNILALRDVLSVEARQEAEQTIVDKVLQLTSFQNAETILLTFPFGSEFSTWPIVRAALQQGKVVVAPRINPARKLDLFAIQNPDSDLELNAQNILEPVPELCCVMEPKDLDWILVPGVAFDRLGGRLGYGGGYYDRLFRDTPRLVPRIAPAFDCQIVDQVPMGVHDHAVDIIVTAQEIIRIESRLLGLK